MDTTKKGVIGILTGGGDVPGLNPAIRAVTIRAFAGGLSGHRHPTWLGGNSLIWSARKMRITATTTRF